MKMFNIRILPYLMGTTVLCMTLNASGQKKAESAIEVSGKFNDKVNFELSLQYRKIGGGRMDFDSAKVVNGLFSFKKATKEPIILTIEVKGKEPGRGGPRNYESFYLNPGEVKMTGSSQFKETDVSGSGTIGNKEYRAYFDSLNYYISKISAANRAVPANLPKEAKEARYTKNMDSIFAVRDERVFLKQVKENPNSLLSVLALNEYASEPVWRPRKKIQPELIEQLLSTLPEKYQSYPSLVSLKQELQISKATGAGKPIIDFALKDASGKTVKLSDFKGKYVFLDFWASWCVPCRKENPNVKAQYQKYKDKGFTVLSVSLDKAEARKAWLDAIENDQIGMWTQLIDENAFAGTVAKSYFITSIPTNFLISPDGKFLDRNLYGDNLDKALARLFENK